MLIRQKLALIVAGSILLLGAVIASLFFDHRQTELMEEKRSLARAIFRETGELRYLAVEYVLHREAGLVRQWEQKHARLTRLTADPVFAGGGDKSLRGDLQANLELTGRLFTRLAEKAPPLPTPHREVLAADERQAALLSLLFVRSNEVLGIAFALQELNVKEDLRRRREMDGVLLALFAVMAAFTAGTAIVLTRSIGWPLAALEEGTAVVARGDLGYRVPVTSRDELGACARSFNDMTARLQERTAQLEAANKELEAFAYSISHDLRAPIRHMSGFVGLLRQRLPEDVEEKTRHYLDVIAEAAREMGRLVDDLLAFSRLGRVEIGRLRLDPRAVLEEALHGLGPEMEGRKVELRIGPLPFVEADPAMLRVVFTNLLGNALKFTRGLPSAVIEVGSRPGEDGHVVFSVADNGTGFDMRYVGKLFTIFQRLHRAEEFEGTGVGLAIVRRIVDRHGGRTWAEGAVGSGATFFFTLPAAQETEA